MPMKRTGLFLAGLLIAALAGCGTPSNGGDGKAIETVEGVTDDEIVVGSHTDLSGATAIWGVGITNGARMRFDELNAAGGVHGRKVRFVVEDTQYQVPRAISAANKLMQRDRIFVMLLALGTPMNNAVMESQFRRGIPNLFPLSGARSMVEPFHPLKFTQRGIYYDEIRAGVRYFVETQGKEAPCLIRHDSDYGIEIREAVVDQTEAMGIGIVAETIHKPTDREFTASVLRLRDAGCDLVLMGTVHADTILILETARKLGWEGVAWVGNNAAYGQVIADQPSGSGEGYYAFVHIAQIYEDDDLSPEARDWFNRYRDAYGEIPGIPAMEGYRAADIFVLALEKAGRDLTREKLLAAITGITDYRDLFGYRVQFGPEDHKGVSESTLSMVKDGRWITLSDSITY